MFRISAALLLILLCSAARTEGLFNADRYRALTEDQRAKHVGDIVTIVIVEDSSAESRNGSSMDGRVAVGADYSDSTNTESGALQLQAEKEGQAETSRRGSLNATVSAEIVDITETGNLLLDGQQEIVINGELQKIRISGVARVQDLTANNVILSSRLASAKISYEGKGLGDGSHRKGVFVWLLQTLRLI